MEGNWEDELNENRDFETDMDNNDHQTAINQSRFNFEANEAEDQPRGRASSINKRLFEGYNQLKTKNETLIKKQNYNNPTQSLYLEAESSTDGKDAKLVKPTPIWEIGNAQNKSPDELYYCHCLNPEELAKYEALTSDQLDEILEYPKSFFNQAKAGNDATLDFFKVPVRKPYHVLKNRIKQYNLDDQKMYIPLEKTIHANPDQRKVNKNNLKISSNICNQPKINNNKLQARQTIIPYIGFYSFWELYRFMFFCPNMIETDSPLSCMSNYMPLVRESFRSVAPKSYAHEFQVALPKFDYFFEAYFTVADLLGRKKDFYDELAGRARLQRDVTNLQNKVAKIVAKAGFKDKTDFRFGTRHSPNDFNSKLSLYRKDASWTDLDVGQKTLLAPYDDYRFRPYSVANKNISNRNNVGGQGTPHRALVRMLEVPPKERYTMTIAEYIAFQVKTEISQAKMDKVVIEDGRVYMENATVQLTEFRETLKNEMLEVAKNSITTVLAGNNEASARFKDHLNAQIAASNSANHKIQSERITHVEKQAEGEKIKVANILKDVNHLRQKFAPDLQKRYDEMKKMLEDEQKERDQKELEHKRREEFNSYAVSHTVKSPTIILNTKNPSQIFYDKNQKSKSIKIGCLINNGGKNPRLLLQTDPSIPAEVHNGVYKHFVNAGNNFGYHMGKEENQPPAIELDGKGESEEHDVLKMAQGKPSPQNPINYSTPNRALGKRKLGDELNTDSSLASKIRKLKPGSQSPETHTQSQVRYSKNKTSDKCVINPLTPHVVKREFINEVSRMLKKYSVKFQNLKYKKLNKIEVIKLPRTKNKIFFQADEDMPVDSLEEHSGLGQTSKIGQNKTNNTKSRNLTPRRIATARLRTRSNPERWQKRNSLIKGQQKLHFTDNNGVQKLGLRRNSYNVAQESEKASIDAFDNNSIENNSIPENLTADLEALLNSSNYSNNTIKSSQAVTETETMASSFTENGSDGSDQDDVFSADKPRGGNVSLDESSEHMDRTLLEYADQLVNLNSKRDDKIAFTKNDIIAKVRDEELSNALLAYTDEMAKDIQLPCPGKFRKELQVTINTKIVRSNEAFKIDTNINENELNQFLSEAQVKYNGLTTLDAKREIEDLTDAITTSDHLYITATKVRLHAKGSTWSKFRYLVFFKPVLLIRVLETLLKNYTYESSQEFDRLETGIILIKLQKLFGALSFDAFLQQTGSSVKNMNAVVPRISNALCTSILTVLENSGIKEIPAWDREVLKNAFSEKYLNKGLIDQFLNLNILTKQSSNHGRKSKRTDSYTGRRLERANKPSLDVYGCDDSGPASPTERPRGLVPHNNQHSIFIPHHVQDRDEIISEQFNNNFYLGSKLTNLNNIKSIPVRNILFNYLNNDHEFRESIRPVSKEVIKSSSVDYIDKSKLFKLMGNNCDPLKNERFSIKINNKTYDKHSMPKKLENNPTKSENLDVKIYYTNLNDPKIQIKNLVNGFPDGSIYCICELNNDGEKLLNYISVPIGFRLFHHKPYIYKGQKFIYSAILVRKNLLENVVQIHSAGPFTSVLYTYNKLKTVITCFYKINEPSKNNRINKKTVMQIANINDSYLDWFEDLTGKVSNCEEHILLGDLNSQYNNPRQNEKTFISRLKGITNRYKNLAKTATFHRKNCLPTAIDICLVKNNFVDKFENIIARSTIRNDGHTLFKIKTGFKTKTSEVVKFFHRPKSDPVIINTVGQEIELEFEKNWDKFKSDNNLKELNIPQEKDEFNFLDTVNEKLIENYSNPYFNILINHIEDTFNTIMPETTREMTCSLFGKFLSKRGRVLQLISASIRSALQDCPNDKILISKLAEIDFELSCEIKNNKRTEYTGKNANEPLNENDLFNINRRLNPKNKESLATKSNLKAEDFRAHFVNLQNEAIKDVVVHNNFESIDHIRPLKEHEKFKFENYPLKWEGFNKTEGLTNSLNSSQPKTRGLHTVANKELIGFLPKTMGKRLAKAIYLNVLMGYYPDCFLKNKLTPIPKKGDLKLVKNYRMLSVPSIYSSLQGKYVAAALSDFIEEKNLLFENQFGFRPGHRCSQAIATIRYWILTKYFGKAIVLVALDLKNAFGRLIYNLILFILSRICSPSAMIYFKNCFRQRSGIIVTNGEMSEEFKLPRVGVPQGEPTSPILFNLVIDYVKTAYKHFTGFELAMFADDMTFLAIADTLEDATAKAGRIADWFEENLKKLGLNISAEKSAALIVGRPKNDHYLPTKITCASGEIKISDSTILLGYNFGDDLKIDKHLDTLKGKLYQQQNMIRNILDYDTIDKQLNLGQSLHHGVTNYMLDILPKLTVAQYKSLQKIFNDTIRMINRVKRSDRFSQKELLRQAGWLCIEKLHVKAVLSHLNQILINEKPAVLYKLLKQSISYSKGDSFHDRKGNNSRRTCGLTFNKQLNLGNRNPTLRVPSMFADNPNCQKVFPFCAFDWFNDLDSGIKHLFGTKQFEDELAFQFKTECQHRNINNCSECTLQAATINQTTEIFSRMTNVRAENAKTQSDYKLLKNLNEESVGWHHDPKANTESRKIIKRGVKVEQFDHFNYNLWFYFKASLKGKGNRVKSNPFKAIKTWSGHTFLNKFIKMEKQLCPATPN